MKLNLLILFLLYFKLVSNQDIFNNVDQREPNMDYVLNLYPKFKHNKFSKYNEIKDKQEDISNVKYNNYNYYDSLSKNFQGKIINPPIISKKNKQKN